MRRLLITLVWAYFLGLLAGPIVSITAFWVWLKAR